jgi:DNA helicase HerA-like ATPase
MFVVLDELNKYAPREGDSPIKQILLDLAERGRSLGVILIGAQQTASEVERRILANCAIRVAGRLDAAEAVRPEYGYLPAVSGSGPRSPSLARCSSPSLTSRSRWWWISRSLRGRPAQVGG